MRIASEDYNIHTNSQVPTPEAINDLPLKSVGNAYVLVSDLGKAEDSGTIQTNIVRIDGQQSVYVPVLKQGGDSNTITIVDGMKAAIKNLIKEASIGLVLTGVMILVFLGSARATIAVLLSIPLSALMCLLIMNAMEGRLTRCFWVVWPSPSRV